MNDSCTLTDVAELVDHHLDWLWADPRNARDVPPMMLWGPPGVGKSDTIRDLCSQKDVGFIDVRLAQMEPVDLRGLPEVRDGLSSWAPSALWPADASSRGIILFDELTAADRMLQVAAYELILDRRLGDLYRLPPGWYVVAAGNRSSDRAVASPMSSALANRFCHLEVKADLETWLGWARAKGLDSAVLDFLAWKPSCFFSMDGDLERGWPSPRSWARVARLMERRDGMSLRVLRKAVVGLVGEGPGYEFLAFLARQAPPLSASDMLAGTATIEVPTRADELRTFCEGVAHHVWQLADREAAFERFFRILDRLGFDFATVLLHEATAGRSADELEALYGHPSFARWRQILAEDGRVTSAFPHFNELTDRLTRELEEFGL